MCLSEKTNRSHKSYEWRKGQMINSYSTSLLIWGVAVHFFCDWILQNAWMADNKSSLLHPAAYVHSGIHLIGLLLLRLLLPFPWWVALIIALTHLLIDTRVPLVWWRKFYRQTTEGPVAIDVAIWSDQAAHITVLAVAALLVAGLK